MAIVVDVSVDSPNPSCPSKPSLIQEMDSRKLYFQALLITAHWILLIRVTLFKNQRQKDEWVLSDDIEGSDQWHSLLCTPLHSAYCILIVSLCEYFSQQTDNSTRIEVMLQRISHPGLQTLSSPAAASLRCPNFQAS